MEEQILKISKIINEKRDLAFILGNGINRFYSNNEDLSWEKLLLNLWNQHASRKLNDKKILKGISFTEFYDAIEIQNFRDKNFDNEIQKNIKHKLISWKPNLEQNKILTKIKRLDVPLMTTNFDDLIPKSLDLEFYKMQTSGFTDYYPWVCYYSNRILRNPTDGFGVWYLNGMIKYHRSIKLGLSHYMGNIERARKMLNNNREDIKFDGKNQNNWSGYSTWMHIIFNRSLFIFGLALEENEIFFRWLLIERAKYFKQFTNRKKDGWYICTKDEQNENFLGKKFFLESIGFQVLELDNFQRLYREIWD